MNKLVLLVCIVVAGVGVTSATKYDLVALQGIFEAAGLAKPSGGITTEESRLAEWFSALHFASRTEPNSPQISYIPGVVLYSFTYDLIDRGLFEVYNRRKVDELKTLGSEYCYSEPTFEEELGFPNFKALSDEGLTKYLTLLKNKNPGVNLDLDTAQVNATLVKISHQIADGAVEEKFYARIQISGTLKN